MDWTVSSYYTIVCIFHNVCSSSTSGAEARRCTVSALNNMSSESSELVRASGSSGSSKLRIGKQFYNLVYSNEIHMKCTGLKIQRNLCCELESRGSISADYSFYASTILLHILWNIVPIWD